MFSSNVFCSVPFENKLGCPGAFLYSPPPPTQQLEDVHAPFVLMTLIITFSQKKKFGKKNVTLDPRLGTLALDMEPSTLDKKIDSL